MSRLRRIRGPSLVAAVLIAGATGACSDSALGPEHMQAGVRVTPSEPVADALGDVIELTAAAKDDRGRGLPDALLEWTYDGAAVEPVEGQANATGRIITAPGAVVQFRSVSNGEARVRATIVSGGPAATATQRELEGSTTVRVHQSVARIEVTPPVHSLWSIGDRVSLAVRASDRNGNRLERPVTFQWLSGDEEVATVDQSGGVLALGDGLVDVIVYTEGQSATASIDVEAMTQYTFCAMIESEHAEEDPGSCANLRIRSHAAGSDGLSRVVRPGDG